MIESITVTNAAGDSLELTLKSPETSGFYVKSIEGLGPVKANINIAESLYMDGGYFNSARGQSRNVVLDLGYFDDGVTSIESIRLKSYKYFPLKKKVTLKIKTDSRVAYTEGYVESNEPDIFSKQEGALISIICPEAPFYDSTIISTLFSGIDGGFEFPFENTSITESTLEFGSLALATVKSVVYEGDEDAGVTMTITLTGPNATSYGNITIYNNTTGQKMQILQSKVEAITSVYPSPQSGDVIVITTQKNKKSITLKRGTSKWNILNALSTDSSWIYIQPGDNLFVYTSTTNTTYIQFLVEHQRLYGGI